MSTPGEPERRSVEKSLDAARRSACATVWSVKLFLRGSLVFPNMGFCINGWGGPPGGCPLGHGTPPSRCPSEESSPSIARQPARGPAGPKAPPRASAPLIMRAYACGKTKRHWAFSRLPGKIARRLGKVSGTGGAARASAFTYRDGGRISAARPARIPTSGCPPRRPSDWSRPGRPLPKRGRWRPDSKCSTHRFPAPCRQCLRR